MGVLSFLLLLTMLAFPLGQVARLQLPNDINISLFDLTVLLTGGVFLLQQVWGKRKFETLTLTGGILLFFLTAVLSLAMNLFRYPLPDLAVASLYAIRWLLFACIYFVVRELPKKLEEKLPLFLTITGASVVVIGYVQYFYYSNLRNLYYLGWDDHLYRMFSSFLDPNFAGVFFCLFFFFLLGQVYQLYSSSSSTSLRINSESRSKQFSSSRQARTIMLGLLSVATFVAIFLTTSRSAVITLAVGLITFLFLIGKKRYIFVFFFLVTVILILASPYFYLENVNPFRIMSTKARLDSINIATTIIQKHSIFGVGFNAYRYAQVQYGFRNPDPLYPSHADSGTDNSFLFVFATTGIIGLFAYLYLLNRIYLLGREKQATVMGKVLLTSLVGLCVSSLFINSLFYPLLLYWLWVISGLTDYR